MPLYSIRSALRRGGLILQCKSNYSTQSQAKSKNTTNVQQSTVPGQHLMWMWCRRATHPGQRMSDMSCDSVQMTQYRLPASSPPVWKFLASQFFLWQQYNYMCIYSYSFFFINHLHRVTRSCNNSSLPLPWQEQSIKLTENTKLEFTQRFGKTGPASKEEGGNGRLTPNLLIFFLYFYLCVNILKPVRQFTKRSWSFWLNRTFQNTELRYAFKVTIKSPFGKDRL